RLSLKLSEKNEIWWSKYDLQLNDLQKNLKTFRFPNELNFLIIDKNNNIVEMKRKKPSRSIKTAQIKSAEKQISPKDTTSPKPGTFTFKRAMSPTTSFEMSNETYPDRVKSLAK